MNGALLGGRIRLDARIGGGGMGAVWRATNEKTGAVVAVKTLHESERTAAQAERFRREARLAAAVAHRHVVRVFDLVEESDGSLALVMELLRGATLEALLTQRAEPLEPKVALAIAVPLLHALDHLHDKGIVHRDLKTANVFLAADPDGLVTPKLLDFGIAREPSEPEGPTGGVLGTPHTMAPEQIGGEAVSGAADLFSFALVLHEMLTGERVFERATAEASIQAVLSDEVDPDPRIDPRLWLVVARALAKRPYERQPSCGAFAKALTGAIGATDAELGEALASLRLGPIEAAPAVFRPSPPRRNVLAAAVALLLAAALVAFLALR